jgi:hypothetical protein
MKSEIRGIEKDGEGFFVVTWSDFAKADKYEIVTQVPALGGIAEIYYKDRGGTLNLFVLQHSWYGGLRGIIRERTDPELEKDPVRKTILERWKDEIYYRYALSESRSDMMDVLFFLMQTLSPDSPPPEHSGRYSRIWVRELDAQRLGNI